MQEPDSWAGALRLLNSLLSPACTAPGWLCAQSLQLCLTLWDPMDGSPPGSSVHGIPQARILEWVTMPSSRRSSQPSDGTHLSYARWAALELLRRKEQDLVPSQQCSGPWAPAMVLSLICSTLGSQSEFLELNLLFFKGARLGPCDLKGILCL